MPDDFLAGGGGVAAAEPGPRTVWKPVAGQPVGGMDQPAGCRGRPRPNENISGLLAGCPGHTAPASLCHLEED